MSNAIALTPSRHRVVAAFDAVLEPQRRQLVLWVPVLFAIGIAVYFAAPREPRIPELLGVVGTGVALIAFAGGGVLARRVILLALAVPCIGFATASIRSHGIAHPVLDRDFYGTITGRVVDLGRSSAGNPRITLENVVLHGGPPVAMVRISLTGEEPLPRALAGREVMVTARIGPPAGPAEPQGFDFRRLAWFDRLSAVGYTDLPVMVRPDDARAPIFRARMAIADGLRARMDEPAAGFAAAILTGDRSSVDQAVLADLRASNLAHLLAISGLHMGLLTAFVFGTVRGGLALVPGIALNYPVKKWGAVAAMLAGAGYLVLSGGSVPTQRAFVMASVVLVAILLDRPAFTLRAVALAAMVILAVRPESLLQAGFQLSFAATAALVAVFEALRRSEWWRDEARGWVSRYRAPLALLITSSVAGLATAPFGAFHFNQVSQFGLLANLLAVPLMGAVIMPAGVVAGVLAPLGLAGPALWLMQSGIETVLGVAHWVAAMEGATRGVKAGPDWVLALLSLAFVWLILWRGPGRWLWLPVAMIAAVGWQASARPDVLISASGQMIGIMTPEGRALSRARGNGFVATSWLSDDGDAVPQAVAAARWREDTGQGWRASPLPHGWMLLQITARSRFPETMPECTPRTIVIAAAWQDPAGLAAPLTGCAELWTRDRLRASGGVAIHLAPDHARAVTVAGTSAARPWTRAGRD